MENLPFSSPHSKETVQRSHCVSPSYQKLCYVRAWAGSLIYGGDCRLIPQLHTIYYTGIKTGTADGWSAWLRVSRLLCGLHHHTWQFFYYAALQVSKPAQNIRPLLHNCPVSKSWIQALSGGLLPCKMHSEHTWLKFLCCLFFLQLALYPVNSALLVDSAHPSFCVPSSFHWLDLWRLFAGCPNGFRQLLELVWTPEALTKSTL